MGLFEKMFGVEQNQYSNAANQNAKRFCQNCGKEADGKDNFCGYCGAALSLSTPKNAVDQDSFTKKKPIYKRPLFWAIIIILILGAVFYNSDSPNSYKISSRYNGMSKDDFISACANVSYESVARNPSAYDGKALTFTGKVIQTQGTTNLTLRINQDNADDKYASDTWYVTAKVNGSSRILETDKIRVYGVCTGTTTYRSVLGQSITIPSMEMKYYTILG